ncbi:hypothetical protein A21D_02628 [Virgibacillus dokdonensis]|uniref:Uncharacterized protein n=1 Tax=Virgibacillus dokdonensis TaxID=302167 RepID=A0A2K9J1S3_9BACI|nr:hypothetical protein A21D_02628 [Virgibacillus dokdonensis]
MSKRTAFMTIKQYVQVFYIKLMLNEKAAGTNHLETTHVILLHNSHAYLNKL